MKRFKIKVGTIKTVTDFLQVLVKLGLRWSAERIIITAAFADSMPKVEESIEFVCATSAELGYSKGCTQEEIYEAGLVLGWKLCQASDGPEIIYHYRCPQSWNIAMEPIKDDEADLRIFIVKRDRRELYLMGASSSPGRFWPSDTCWVFRHV